MDREKLIEEVRKYPILYDISDSKYSDAERKERVWRQIATALSQPAQTNRRTSFLDEVILSSRDGNGFTNVELREETLTLLVAGIDTTATGASCAILMLSRYNDVQEKAYQEVYNIFGDSKRHASFEDLSKLIYIEAFIKEILRFYPPTPVILRENDVDVPLASGIILPAGTYTGSNIWGLHRNPRYWGSDAEEFNPDRFLNGSPTERTAFLPFSFGPRDCLGRMDTIKKFARAAIESEYGVTCFWIGTKFSVVTCDATLSEEVAKNCLGKSDLTYHMTKHLMGNAHIFAPVHIWRPRRKAITNAFSSKYLRYYVEVFAEQAATLTESLRPVADGRTFSIWKYFTAYTMNTVCETTLGIKMNVGTQSVHPFVAEVNRYLEILPALIALPSRNVELFFKYLPVYKEMENSKILIHNIVGDLIKKKQKLLQHENNNSKHNKALQNSAENSETKRGKRTFLEELMTAEDGNGFSAEELQEEALTLFIAGTDTISLSVSCATVLLSRNMHVQEKAYQEVYSIFGESKRLITFEDLPKLQYVDALIKETLRLYPPVPMINRENNVEITLASKIVLPVGTYTVINIWGLHRNPKYWGSDAEEFNPDRFLNGSVIERGAYIPFSYGPRNCIGYKYAMMSMKVIMTSLLREYKVLPPSDLAPEDLKKPLRTEFKMMMKAGNSEVRLESRK